jgi:hypothetical protein
MLVTNNLVCKLIINIDGLSISWAAMTKSILSDLSTDKSEVYCLFTDLYLRNIVR